MFPRCHKLVNAPCVCVCVCVCVNALICDDIHPPISTPVHTWHVLTTMHTDKDTETYVHLAFQLKLLLQTAYFMLNQRCMLFQPLIVAFRLQKERRGGGGERVSERCSQGSTSCWINTHTPISSICATGTTTFSQEIRSAGCGLCAADAICAEIRRLRSSEGVQASATFSGCLSGSAYTREQHWQQRLSFRDASSCCYIPRRRRGRRRAQTRPEALASGGWAAARRMSAQSRPLCAACMPLQAASSLLIPLVSLSESKWGSAEFVTKVDLHPAIDLFRLRKTVFDKNVFINPSGLRVLVKKFKGGVF